MKVHLMSPVDDFAPSAPEPPFSDALVQDLQLDRLLDAMSAGDSFLRDVARSALLHPVREPAVIAWRQDAYADCILRPDTFEGLYQIAVDALNVRRGIHGLVIRGHPDAQRYHAVEMLTLLAEHLDKLRATRPPDGVGSAALRGLFQTIAANLDDDYMRRLRQTLRELGFRDGMLTSFGIGIGGEVVEQVLRRPKDSNRGVFNRTPLKRPMYSFMLPENDEAGGRALSELRDRSVNEASNAGEQAVDHVIAFFSALRAEVGFHLACRNLDRALSALGVPLTRPRIVDDAGLAACGLVDPCLALSTGLAPVGSDVDLGAGNLLVITGANRGGKSTLLRALGVAQLMAQAGMPVAASSFVASPVGSVFTHWTREEDTGLRQGKLDEELDRMERIVDVIAAGDLLLSNESFASTNEAEGSAIATEVVSALVHNGVQVRTVTHLYDHAESLARDESLGAVFLRAQRGDDGRRSFRLEPGLPLPTSFGMDLYDNLFGTHYAEDAATGVKGLELQGRDPV